MNDAFLHITGLTRKFGRITALDRVDLAVGKDELLVVLGPTGAGKTTLLRAIAGLETPDAGSIMIAGQDVVSMTPAARDAALVFQNFSLYPRWTVRRNLAFPLKAPARGLSAGEIVQRVEWAADLLRITELLDRDVTDLSGGQMQRVAIGRAIVRRPRIFLMDEPLSNLDAKLRETLRVELVVLRRELGVPMVYVTHDQTEALSMADRIAVLFEGRILQTGTPEKVYTQPASAEAARQLGQPRVNLFDAVREGGEWTVNGRRLMPAGGECDTCVIGIRPEDIRVANGPHPAHVSVVENMGSHKVIAAEWLGRTVHIIAPPSIETAPGDTIHPAFDRDKVLVW